MPCGAIYKIDTTGHLSTVYAFQGPPDGASPWAVISVPGVSISHSGTLYGTTQYGGTSTYQYCNGGNGCGTVPMFCDDLRARGVAIDLSLFVGRGERKPISEMMREPGGPLAQA